VLDVGGQERPVADPTTPVVARFQRLAGSAATRRARSGATPAPCSADSAVIGRRPGHGLQACDACLGCGRALRASEVGGRVERVGSDVITSSVVRV